MNVLYVSDSTTVSGAEIVLLGHLDGLPRAAFKPHVFLSASNPRLIESLRRRGIAYTATRAYSDRLLRTTLDPVSLIHFAASFVRLTRALRRVIRAREIDLIHSISYPASLYAACAAKLTRTPHIWHEHNIKRIHRVNRVLYQFAGSSCAWIIGPSRAVVENLHRAGIDAARLRAVYNGIDIQRFSPSEERTHEVRDSLGLAPGQCAVGLFGQLLPYKGHRTLIDAAPAVLQRHPGTKFFLIGALENPPYEAQLRHRIAERGLDGQVRFTGWRDDVQDVIRAMDVVVVATITPEPAALALMETMAMARPIVATRTGGTAEIVEDGRTGLLFTPDDATALATALNGLLADATLRSTLGDAGRLTVERQFSRRQHLQTMQELYEQATQQQRRYR
jgi:glycosyltransferase involved in cell wall biosynthesis